MPRNHSLLQTLSAESQFHHFIYTIQKISFIYGFLFKAKFSWMRCTSMMGCKIRAAQASAIKVSCGSTTV